VDCLRKLHASKGSRNALKGLDYDAVKLLRMDFLPPVFNGDVIFELPLVGVLSRICKPNSWWEWTSDMTKTITSYIKNDMGLTFRTSSCIGHLRCNNEDCEYLVVSTTSIP
jgi:hypothetical protein